MQQWDELLQKPEYSVLHSAIKNGIEMTEKYFGKATQSSVQIMNLCKCANQCLKLFANVTLVLNPAAKHDYFMLYWSEDGRKHAEDIITKVVRCLLIYHTLF